MAAFGRRGKGKRRKIHQKRGKYLKIPSCAYVWRAFSALLLNVHPFYTCPDSSVEKRSDSQEENAEPVDNKVREEEEEENGEEEEENGGEEAPLKDLDPPVIPVLLFACNRSTFVNKFSRRGGRKNSFFGIYLPLYNLLRTSISLGQYRHKPLF